MAIRRRRKIPLRGPWALLAGVLFLGIGFYQLLTSSDLLERGVLVEATVVDVDSRRRKMRTKYALTLRFEDLGGLERRGRTGYREAYGEYRKGERVAIRYNPERPSEFAIDGFMGLWLGPIVFSGIGLLACMAFLFGPARH